MIDQSAAPPFVNQPPPNRQEASYAEHLQAALQIFATRPLEEQEMMAFKLFMVETDRIIKEKTGQATPTGDPNAETAEDEQDITNQETAEYGSEAGAPVEEDQYA